MRGGIDIYCETDENGERRFDLYMPDDEGKMQLFFSGDTVDTAQLFDKMDTVCEGEYADLDDAMLAAMFVGYKQESIDHDTIDINLYPLQ